MERPRVPVRDMTQEQFDDFANQMYVLLCEHAVLWEYPAGSTDHERDGRVSVHGPWDWHDCRDALKVWHNDGLIRFYRDADTDLSDEEARAVLDDADAWRTPTEANGWRLSRWGHAVAYAAEPHAETVASWTTRLATLREG